MLDDFVGHQVGRNTATDGRDLGLNHLGLMGERVLVLNDPAGLRRFGAGRHAVGDVQINSLIRLGGQPVVGWLVRGQIVVSRSEVGQ